MAAEVDLAIVEVEVDSVVIVRAEEALVAAVAVASVTVEGAVDLAHAGS